MSCSLTQYKFQIGGGACMPFSFKDVNGNPVDADALPAVLNSEVHVNGVATTIVAGMGVTITQKQDTTPANIVGEYELCFDPTFFNSGDVIDFIIEGAVGGVTLRTQRQACVVDVPADRPSIC